MSQPCAFEGCDKRATRWEQVNIPPIVLVMRHPLETKSPVRAFCDSHYGEDECPAHVASEADGKICERCGIHIDSLRPPEEGD